MISKINTKEASKNHVVFVKDTVDSGRTICMPIEKGQTSLELLSAAVREFALPEHKFQGLKLTLGGKSLKNDPLEKMVDAVASFETLLLVSETLAGGSSGKRSGSKPRRFIIHATTESDCDDDDNF